MEGRKKTGVAFWASALLVAVIVGYPLSFGPACWLADRDVISFRTVVRGYPWLYRLATYNKQPWGRGLRRYANALNSPDTHEMTWDLYAARIKMERERMEREEHH